MKRGITVQEGTSSVHRRFAITVPSKYDANTPMPVVLHFHGQSDTWGDPGRWDALGERHGFITVYPRGMGDFGGKDREADIAWNVGLLDKGMAAANESCFEDTQPSCYDSCSECSRCSWSTCHDDVAFVRQLHAQLAAELCIDLHAVS